MGLLRLPNLCFLICFSDAREPTMLDRALFASNAALAIVGV
jgi:hypothetical protein